MKVSIAVYLFTILSRNLSALFRSIYKYFVSIMASSASISSVFPLFPSWNNAEMWLYCIFVSKLRKYYNIAQTIKNMLAENSNILKNHSNNKCT